MQKRFTAGVCVLVVVAAVSGAPPALRAADPPPAAEPVTKPPDAGTPANKEVKPAPTQPSPSSLGTPAVVVDDSTVASLLGKDVKSTTGEKLGQVTDIIVGHSGDVRAAVIDFGGFLGVGSRKIAVAWAVLHFLPDGIVLGMGPNELRVTPEYHPGEPIVIVGSAGTPPPQVKPSSSTQSPAAAK